MFRAGKWAAAVAVASVWAGVAPAAQEPKAARPAAPADAKPADLTALREAVDTAARRGENVDEVRKAFAAFEKALPTIKPGRVPPELQALRDAVDAAAKKGENVDAVAKELVAVETAVAGRSLAKPKPDPRAEVPPNPLNPRDPGLAPFPAFPFPGNPDGGVDAEALRKAMELQMRAMELMRKNPRDPDAQKLLNEAMLKALGGAGGGAMPALPAFPDFARVPDRARLGVRMEKLAPITAEQLGLDANVGIAVAAVVPGSVAEKAGLKAHDIILEFAGKPVSDSPENFARLVSAAKAGEKIDLVVMRKGKKVDVKGVVLPAADGVPAAPRADPQLNLLLPLQELLDPLPNPPAIPPAPALPPVQVNPPPLPPPPPQLPPVRDGAPVDIRAAADEPRVANPDLGELRDAVAAAAKKGENVETIRDALAALEKVQAKGAAKPGEAPPELTALRAAVEGASKKGENVEAIAKELARVEKAVTGRAYERPRVAEPQPDPVRPFPPRRAGIVISGAVISGAGGANGTSVTISNGGFTIKERRGDVTYIVTGTADATVAPKITIKDGEKTTETDDLKKVPDDHRPAVERLLKMVNRG